MVKFKWLAVSLRSWASWRSRLPRAATTTTTGAEAVVVALAAESGSIALLLPESKTARYESQDRPNFERKAKELCADCKIIYSNADQDAAKQQQQAEAAITNGAKVLVLDPVDAASAGAIVNNAKSRHIPVVSYDRLITDADIDYYISFDNEQVGKLQGESLVKSSRTTAPRAASS